MGRIDFQALLKALKDKDQEQRQAACAALEKIRKSAVARAEEQDRAISWVASVLCLIALILLLICKSAQIPCEWARMTYPQFILEYFDLPFSWLFVLSGLYGRVPLKVVPGIPLQRPRFQVVSLRIRTILLRISNLQLPAISSKNSVRSSAAQHLDNHIVTGYNPPGS